MNESSPLSLPSRLGATVRATTEPDEVRRILDTQRAIAAPVYGYLDKRYANHTHWYVASAGRDTGLMFWVDGAPGANLYLQGEEAALSALLREVDAPRYSFLLFQQHVEPLVRAHFLLRGLQRLIRMRVDRATFRPAEPHPNASPGIVGPVRLGGADLIAVNGLYRTDSGARITRDYLMGGVYFGMWHGTQLVSVAGTQLFHPSHGIGVVANVLTHPRHRNRGYATQCVSAVTAALLEDVPDVVLNVDPGNTPAVHSYQRLGFTAVGEVAETWAFWKGRNWADRLGAQLMYWLMG